MRTNGVRRTGMKKGQVESRGPRLAPVSQMPEAGSSLGCPSQATWEEFQLSPSQQ